MTLLGTCLFSFQLTFFLYISTPVCTYTVSISILFYVYNKLCAIIITFYIRGEELYDAYRDKLEYRREHKPVAVSLVVSALETKLKHEFCG